MKEDNELKKINPMYILGKSYVSCSQDFNFKILDDVPKDQKNWAIVRFSLNKYARRQPIMELLEIHIHEAKDIEGGSWKRRINKCETEIGTTTVID